MSIKVEIKTVYGEQRIYPACETSQVFASMVGQKTLTHRDIQHIKQLGYKIEVVQTRVEL